MGKRPANLHEKATILIAAIITDDDKACLEFDISLRTLQRYKAQLTTSSELAKLVTQQLRLFRPATPHERASKHLAENLAPRVYGSLEKALDALDANTAALKGMLDQIQQAVAKDGHRAASPDTITALSRWVESTATWHDRVAQVENARQLGLAYIESLHDDESLELESPAPTGTANGVTKLPIPPKLEAV